MDSTCNIDEQNSHSSQYIYLTFPRYYRGIFKVVVALVFTAVQPIFTHGGPKVGACSKDEVLRQPDESILSDGTVFLSMVGKSPKFGRM